MRQLLSERPGSPFDVAPSALASSDPDDGVEFWDQTNRQDWHVCELSQAGVQSRSYTPGPYSRREGLSAAFDQEVLRALGHRTEW